MLNLTPEQHAKILGWGLIGFGTGHLIANVDKMWMLMQVKESAAILWISILVAWVTFFVSLLAGIDIKDANPATQKSGLGLTFVVVAIATFPLGTILGTYVLIYLFAIRRKKEPQVSALGEDSRDDG